MLRDLTFLESSFFHEGSTHLLSLSLLSLSPTLFGVRDPFPTVVSTSVKGY